MPMQTSHSSRAIQPLTEWRTAPARVLIVDGNQAVLNSLEHWLNRAHAIAIVGKHGTAAMALETWEITQPNIMILSLPQENDAIIASAAAALAAKALTPELRIVALAWCLSAADQEKWALFAEIADAWIFKESVLYDLIPTLIQLRPPNPRLDQ